jgi:hypothetical protein
VPSFVPAYLDLATLHNKEGDAARAKKMRATALELLQAMTPQAVVEPYGLTAQEMIRRLEARPSRMRHNVCRSMDMKPLPTSSHYGICSLPDFWFARLTLRVTALAVREIISCLS